MVNPQIEPGVLQEVDTSGGDVSVNARGIIIGAEGTVVVDMPGQSNITIPLGVLSAGVLYPILVSKVYAASTATDIWVLVSPGHTFA